MIVAGFGFRADAPVDSLSDALARVGGFADALAAPVDKAEDPAFRAMVKALGLPAIPVPQALLERQATATRSVRSMAARRAGSVAEAAALAGAGPGARLLTVRAISSDRRATCALAVGPGREEMLT